MDGMEQMVDDGYLDCPVCGGPCPAEVPECGDGHGPTAPIVCLRPLRHGPVRRPGPAPRHPSARSPSRLIPAPPMASSTPVCPGR